MNTERDTEWTSSRTRFFIVLGPQSLSKLVVSHKQSHPHPLRLAIAVYSVENRTADSRHKEDWIPTRRLFLVCVVNSASPPKRPHSADCLFAMLLLINDTSYMRLPQNHVASTNAHKSRVRTAFLTLDESQTLILDRCAVWPASECVQSRNVPH